MNQLKSYNTRNEIFLDLSLDKNEMDALIDIFEDYGKFEYDPETKHVFTPKPGVWVITNRLEETVRGINFVIWTYTSRD